MLGRRKLIGLTGLSAATVWLGTGLYGTGRARAMPLVQAYPFSLGVASGDPRQTSVVLWTRLAPEPTHDDGGMPATQVEVAYEVSEDESFATVVDHGTAVASPELAHSVHVVAKNLLPGRHYFYRFHVDGQTKETSQVGRTRTAPSGATASMRFAVASCQHYEEGYFSAYRHILADEPDLVAHCGDYIYESKSGLSTQPRTHSVPEPYDLAAYRQRFVQYRSDPDLMNAHIQLPWVFTYDDHEVDNNWAGDISEFYPDVSKEEFRLRRAAFQAYYEHLPLRPGQRPEGPDITLYRRIRYGNLATFHVLDGRLFRDPQLDCTDPMSCPGRDDPERTMLGDTQESWLLDDLRDNPTTWNMLVQQVPFTQLDELAGEGYRFGKDNWNYFPAARKRIVDELVRKPDINGVFLGGEIHRHLAADVKADYSDPNAPAVASELVSTSIASGGNGNPNSEWVQRILAENPHITYAHERRGYLRVDVEQGQLRADLQVVPIVTDPGSGVETGASYVVEAGNPGLVGA